MSLVNYPVYCKIEADPAHTEFIVRAIVEGLPADEIRWEHDSGLLFKSRTRIAPAFVKRDFVPRVSAIAAQLAAPVSFTILENHGGGIAKAHCARQ